MIYIVTWKYLQAIWLSEKKNQLQKRIFNYIFVKVKVCIFM